MMKSKLTKLTSAFIDDNSGPLLITGKLIKGSKPNAKFNLSVVSISQLKEPNSSSLQTKTAYHYNYFSIGQEVISIHYL